MPSVNAASCSLAVTPSVLGPTSQMENVSSKNYMLLPCLIIASMITWNDKQLERIFRFSATTHQLQREGAAAGGNSAASSFYMFFRLQCLDFFGARQCLSMETGICAVEARRR